MKKYSVLITDKNYLNVPQNPKEDKKIDIQSELSYRNKYGWEQVYTKDIYEVVVEANNEDEAWKIAHEMFLDGEFDCYDSDYCLSKEGCGWWEDSQANPRSHFGIAYETFGDDVVLDGGTMDYDVLEEEE